MIQQSNQRLTVSSLPLMLRLKKIDAFDLMLATVD